MQPHLPFFREAGAGPGVVCTHSNAASSSQWRALMDELSPRFRVFAADSFGAGKSPPWPKDRQIGLQDEADLLEPVFQLAGDPFALVGHSYGAAVALIAALQRPERVRKLAVYEPTMFCLLEQEMPPTGQASGIRDAVRDAAALIARNDHLGAARRFIDYWMGDGAWDRTPAERQPAIAASMINIRNWGEVLFREQTTLNAFRALDIPVLYMLGGQTPESARGVARLLTAALPNVEVVEFAQLGHMGPVTHPEVVNPTIARFLAI